MEDNDKSPLVPYFIVESIADRQSLTIKRLWIMCIILIFLLLSTNAMWICYESQFEGYEEIVEQDVDTGDGNTTIVGIGDKNDKN